MDANSSGSANRSTTIAIANLDHRVSITKKIGTAIDPWTRDQLWVVCQSQSTSRLSILKRYQNLVVRGLELGGVSDNSP